VTLLASDILAAGAFHFVRQQRGTASSTWRRDEVELGLPGIRQGTKVRNQDKYDLNRRQRRQQRDVSVNDVTWIRSMKTINHGFHG